MLNYAKPHFFWRYSPTFSAMFMSYRLAENNNKTKSIMPLNTCIMSFLRRKETEIWIFVQSFSSAKLISKAPKRKEKTFPLKLQHNPDSVSPVSMMMIEFALFFNKMQHQTRLLDIRSLAMQLCTILKSVINLT